MRLFIFVLFLVGLMVGISGCQEGPRGYTGAPGIDGTNGNDGATGATGPAGQDGLPARIVQLCPGVTAYPGVFVEVALCLNNELYGVYSANNGFLTKFPPGAYHSNAIGSACNLTVHANCVVTN